MAYLAETETYEAGVYQLEITDPVIGGPDGIDNLQGKQLANRTNWLKAKIDSILSMSFIHAAVEENPGGTDEFGYWDSFTQSLKRVSLTNLIAVLKTQFDTLYATINSITSKIQPITASVATSALTATLNPTTLDFRSATLGSGAVTTINVASAISLVVPSTATLGTTNAVLSRLILIAINNAGTVELAIVNSSGGNNLDETTLISTTALSATADLANVIYSTTARTNVPFRVVGYIESTQAIAGTWATAPSTIQGDGGQALAAMSSLGYGQTWQNVTASRVAGTTYTNTTGKPITLTIQLQDTSDHAIEVGGIDVCKTDLSGTSGNFISLIAIVPNGFTFRLRASAFLYWAELR